MICRLFELSPKTECFSHCCSPSHQDLPGELLYPKEGLAQAHSPDRSIGSQFVRRVQECVGVLHSPIQLKIILGFLAAPHLLPPRPKDPGVEREIAKERFRAEQ
jgi:hypothetical protein